MSALLCIKIVSSVGDKMLAGVNPARTPRLGARVFCNEKELGKVVDLIGNIKKPYCVIRYNKKSAARKDIVGEEVSLED